MSHATFVPLRLPPQAKELANSLNMFAFFGYILGVALVIMTYLNTATLTDFGLLVVQYRPLLLMGLLAYVLSFVFDSGTKTALLARHLAWSSLLLFIGISFAWPLAGTLLGYVVLLGLELHLLSKANRWWLQHKETLRPLLDRLRDDPLFAKAVVAERFAVALSYSQLEAVLRLDIYAGNNPLAVLPHEESLLILAKLYNASQGLERTLPAITAEYGGYLITPTNGPLMFFQHSELEAFVRDAKQALKQTA